MNKSNYLKPLLTFILLFCSKNYSLFSVLPEGMVCTFKKNRWYSTCTIIRPMTYEEIEEELKKKSAIAVHFSIDCAEEFDSSDFTNSEIFTIIAEDFKKYNSYGIFGKNFTFLKKDPGFYLVNCICKKGRKRTPPRIIHQHWIVPRHELHSIVVYGIE